MPSQLEAIEIKRKMYFEFENAPYVCLDVEVSSHRPRRPDAGAPEDAQPHARNVRQDVRRRERWAGPRKGRGVPPVLTATTTTHGQQHVRYVVQRRHAGRRSPRPTTRPAGAQYNGGLIGLIFRRSGNDGHDRTGRPRRYGQRRRTKAATLETGLVVRVPLFVKEGENASTPKPASSRTGLAT